MVLLSWLWPTLALAASSLSLPQYLSEVKANYPSLAAARARADALESRVSPAGAWDDPFFAMGVDQIPTKGMDTTSVWRYQLSQTIPFPGKRGSAGKAAEARASGAKADADSLERELTLIAIQLYYRACYVDAALNANESLRKILDGTIVSNQARYKTGGSGHHEWLLAKAELSVLNVEKLRFERERKLLHARMNEMRGKPADAPVGELKPSFSEGKNPQPDLQGQPELKAFDAAVGAASAEETAAKFAYAPDFVLQGMLMKPKAMPAEGMTPMQSSWGFMVGVNVPLFFAWKQAPMVTAARLDKEAATLERQSLENRLNTEIVDAKEQLRTAHNIVELYKSSVIPSTRLAAGNARSAYAAKRFPVSQYLDILKSERTQELELLAARIDVEVAAARLENLLSAPPVSRFAPSRPSLFGGMGGGGMSEMPEATSMGRGTIAPKKSSTGGSAPSGGGGMEGM